MKRIFQLVTLSLFAILDLCITTTHNLSKNRIFLFWYKRNMQKKHKTLKKLLGRAWPLRSALAGQLGKFYYFWCGVGGEVLLCELPNVHIC